MSESKIDIEQLTCALEGVDFPAAKGDLIAKARENKAADSVLDTLAVIPEAQPYTSVTGVADSIERNA